MKQHLVLLSLFNTFLHCFEDLPKNIWARDETVIALELFLSGHDFDSKTDERVGGEKRNVQSLKSGMKILEIAQWDTWSRSFGEIVSIFLIFGSGWHCHLSFLDQRFLCLMFSIYFKSQNAPKPVTRRNVTKEHSTHNFGEYEHYKILMVTSFGTFWLL